MKFNGGNAPAIGRAIYNDKIRPTLGPEHKGKVVVIDVKSGDYEIDRSDLAADLRLRKRRPNAFTWAERVGSPAVYRMGSRYRPRSQRRD